MNSSSESSSFQVISPRSVSSSGGGGAQVLLNSTASGHQKPSRPSPGHQLSPSSHTPVASPHINQMSTEDNNGLIDHVDSKLRVESETRRGVRKEPSEASEEAAFDRMVLPHLNPIDLSSPTTSMQVDQAQNIFLFVNPTSGGNAAATFMEAGLEHIRLTVDQPVNLWIWDIRQGQSGQKPGFIKLKRIVEGLQMQLKQQKQQQATTSSEQHNQQQHPQNQSHRDVVYVIVAGGDGTVMWCITELWAHGINDERIALGVVPYGTGNDFARALGWQKFNAAKPYENKFKILKELVKEWLNAKIVLHDIWEVSMRVQPEGTFQKIDSTTRHKKPVGGIRPVVGERMLSKTISSMEALGEVPIQMDSRVLCLKMCNYFSCGIESRIGIGFDRYRTKSQFCNKMRYGIEGGKKAIFRKTQNINSLIEFVSEEMEDGTRNILFSTDGLNDEMQLEPSTMSLIASNIPSFAAGLDLWGTTKSVGIKPAAGKTISPSLKQHEQRLGDGTLEFISFNGAMSLGVERAIHGRGKRVGTGRGPFELKFKDLAPLESATKQKPETRVYFQVDGEFFIMTRPESIHINFKRRIKVLASLSSNDKYFIPAITTPS